MTTENPSVNYLVISALGELGRGMGHKLEASLGYLLKLVSA